MANPYGSFFGSRPPTGTPRPGNPYAELFAPKTPGPEDEWERRGVFEVNRRTRERRLAPAFEGGQPALGTVATPDTSAGAITREALGLAGSTAVNVAAQGARLPTLLDREIDAGVRHFADRAKGNQRTLAQAREESERQGLDPLGRTSRYTADLEQQARERLAEASQDLPTPLAVAIHQNATMAGMLADPTLAFGGAGRGPRLTEAGEDVAAAAPGRLKQTWQRVRSAIDEDAQVRELYDKYPGYREAWDAEHNALGFRRKPDLSEAIPEVGAGGDRAATGLPAPNPAEAGFVRNPWAPESSLYKQSYELRHDFVTEQNVAGYLSAKRSRALEQAIPSPQAREDMTAVFHGTGNPMVAGDTAAAARARLAASPYAKDAEQALAAWRRRSDELWQMANDLSAERLGYFRDYLHMVYNPPAGEKLVGDLGRRAPGTTSVMKERFFASPAEAIEAGWTPRNLDFSVLMHETERAHAHTRAILGLVDDLKTASRQIDPQLGRAPILRADRNPDPSRFIRANPDKYPILQKALPGPDEWMGDLERMRGEFDAGLAARELPPPPQQAALPGMEPSPRVGQGGREALQPPLPFELPPEGARKAEGIYVDKDLWRNLTPILDSDSPAALDKALAVVKRINFLGSLFHGASLGEAAVGSIGHKAIPMVIKKGGGIPVLSQIAKRLGGGQLADDAVQRWVRAGVNVEPPRLDQMAGAFDDALRRAEDRMLRPQTGEPGLLRRAAAKTSRGVRGTAAYYDEALWENAHAPYKITAAEIIFEQQMKRRAVQKAIASGKMTVTEVERDVARSVNNHFGGQNWQLVEGPLAELFNNPTAMKWMRRVFLSPDWNYSAISTALEPFSKSMVRRSIGRRYWRNVGITFAVLWNTLNMALSGHPMWENEEGHKFDLDTGLRDEKEDGSPGRKIFFQVGKHALELPHFIGSPVGFLARKANPVLSGVISAVSGYSPSGIPGPLGRAQDEAERGGYELSREEQTLRRLQSVAGGAVPFVAQRPGEIGRRLIVPFVETKGMSLHDGELQLAKAIRDGDAARAAQIRRWLAENGYSGEDINRAAGRARGKVKRNPNPYTGMF